MVQQVTREKETKGEEACVEAEAVEERRVRFGSPIVGISEQSEPYDEVLTSTSSAAL